MLLLPTSENAIEFTQMCQTFFKQEQVAQLSQIDRTAEWVSFGQKQKTIFCRHYRSIFNHCDVIGLQNYPIR